MPPRALIVGLAGARLSAAERAYLEGADPWGVILFARNVESPDQLKELTAEIRDGLSRADAPILIDQEGGRVQRMGPPHWPAYPAGRRIGELYTIDPQAGLEAAHLAGRLIATDLAGAGINVACIPLLDLRLEGMDQVIGDRAYDSDPEIVTALGRAAAEGVRAGGCLPVIKHMPGHGRVLCDTHYALPVVDLAAHQLRRTDFAPFRELRALPLGMSAHVVYSAFDSERPATVSPSIITQVIRSEIGFDGLLMTDDISMQALDGAVEQRACAALAAGCDIVLHCNGDAHEMERLAEAVPHLSGRALERAEAALAALDGPAAPAAPAADVTYERLQALLAKAA
ncbi:MAG: beta-N-acetylhexosaminidase [Rhizobiales bacterium]|nr:beta-N-acetylhexosaminidase [Hyphomicrobiales bacterium]